MAKLTQKDNEKKKQTIFKPHEGFQEKFCRANVDVCFGGGAAGAGKTAGAALAMAEWVLDPNFRAIFLRRTLGDLKTVGGVVDTFKQIYGKHVSIKISENPRIRFPSGAEVECRQIADENPKKVQEIWKGVQADVFYFDELTSFNFETFTYLMSRNRGMGSGGNHIFATMNPKRNHWVRKFLDAYIGVDGYIKPEMDGIVRYFYLNGDTVDDVVWGDSKAEVYAKCKIDIDRKLKRIGGDFTYESMIKSFTFYQGRVSENKSMLDKNEGYVGSLAASGGISRALVEGNWNYDEAENTDAPIPSHIAQSVFTNDPQVNGDLWITADLADFGTDNMIAYVWNGFHVIDVVIMNRTTPRMNAERLQVLAAKHGIADSHIIFDGTGGRYINDYIPDAIPFLSSHAPVGMYARMAWILKDECYMRLIKMMENGNISVSDEVAKIKYTHQNLKCGITLQTEFIEECSVVRFKQMPNGKKRLANKREMNLMLGKGRSMDVLDPFAMRMYPVLQYEYGSELHDSAKWDDVEYNGAGTVDIYSDNVWC